MSAGNKDYNIANDVINVKRDTPLDDFPVVTINEFPIPRKAYEFVLELQHLTMVELQHYPTRIPITINGEKRYVNLKPKVQEQR